MPKIIKLPILNFLNRRDRGFTFIDVLVGIGLMVVVFSGILGAYQLSIKTVAQSKNKIIATAIAQGEIEKIRNLPYQSIGTVGAELPYAEGSLESSTSTEINNVVYAIERKIKYIADSADGLTDSCPNDYKVVEAKVSWAGRFPGNIKLVSNVSPENLSQECETGGGILSASVFDAYGNMVLSPIIEVFNASDNSLVDSVTPFTGQHNFPLATSTYKVVVSKGESYSSERTYGISEIAAPLKPHPIVLGGQLTEISFSIDKVSGFSVNTLSPWAVDFFSDSFSNGSKISEYSNVAISGGEVKLATTSQGYFSSGYLISTSISPESLISWNEFSFSDSEPMNTGAAYQIYHASGTEWYLIPDVDLPENSIGFDVSPVDLSGLSAADYSQLKLRGNLLTDSTSTTPSLYDWQISWITSESTAVPDAIFNLRGSKIIGYDADENPVYKFSSQFGSDSGGRVNISGLEWDSYSFSVDPATGLDLIDINPAPQPISLSPDVVLSCDLYLDAQDSLLIAVQNSATDEPVFSASVRLYNAGLGYDVSQYANEKGQTYFIPLEPEVYNLEVSASGYSATSTTGVVSGDVIKTIKLEQVE